MRNMYEKIQELAHIPSFSKHEQLVRGIINAIDEKLLSVGDALPSVNAMNKELGFAKETIVKAYTELKNRGIIESRNRLGYFVVNEDTAQTLKVALMMYGYDTFQELFYKNFRNGLGDKVHLDVFFHHGNISVFETMLDMVRGKYGMYVISPIPHPKSAALLQPIPFHKFIMFDRYEPLEGDFNYVTQEFEKSTYAALAALADTIRRFNEILFFYPPNSLIPIEILKSFKKFLQDFHIKGGVRAEYIPGSIQKGKVYFTLDNTELYRMIKDAKAQKLILGKDVGLLSHNDEPVKELIGDGITTFSTDFGLMGKKVAAFVLSREKIQETLPTILIQRNSL
jgi:DNA-binding transcriptional regulator YhcF (GntR family)